MSDEPEVETAAVAPPTFEKAPDSNDSGKAIIAFVQSLPPGTGFAVRSVGGLCFVGGFVNYFALANSNGASSGLWGASILVTIVGFALEVKKPKKKSAAANTTSMSAAAGIGTGEGGEEASLLPAGWLAGTDTATGQPYFYNDKGESSWERPSE